MNVFLSRILVMSGTSGLLLLGAADGLRAAAPRTNGPAQADRSPKRVDQSAKRADSKSKRPDRSSSRPDSSSKGAQSKAPGGQTNVLRTDYASYKVISDRNIFNGNRRGGMRANGEPARVEFFALAGTLSSEKGTFAFFDGSSREFQKVVKPQGEIAGFKITDIAPSAAKLEAGDQTVEMPVGMQMLREDEGEWKLAARSYTPSSPDNRASSDRSSGSRFGGDRGPSDRGSTRFSGGDRGSSRFSGGDRGSSRFGGDRGTSNGGPSRFGGDRGSGDRGSSSPSGGDRGSSGRDSGSRMSDSRGTGDSGAGNQSSGGTSSDEVLRRLKEQAARERR